MSFKVDTPCGNVLFVNGLAYGTKSYKELEKIALDLAEKVGGTAYYENGNPRFQKGGVDLFPRWIPIGFEPSEEEKKLTSLFKKTQEILKAVK